MRNSIKTYMYTLCKCKLIRLFASSFSNPLHSSVFYRNVRVEILALLFMNGSLVRESS